jgi:hypothetical protein
MRKANEPRDIHVTPCTHVVQYVRMSSEHGPHSTENQLNVIRIYAEVRNMRIVETYSERNKVGSDGLVDK